VKNKIIDWVTFAAFFFVLSILLWAAIKISHAEQITGISTQVETSYAGKILYALNSGMYYQTGRECAIPDYAEVLLNNTGKYDVTYYVFSGEKQSTVHWETPKERVKDCEIEDCSQSIVEQYSEWQSCNITGLIGGVNVTTATCTETYPVFIENSLQYYIPNTHVFNGYRDTGIIIPEVVLQYNSGNSCFDIEEINQ